MCQIIVIDSKLFCYPLFKPFKKKVFSFFVNLELLPMYITEVDCF